MSRATTLTSVAQQLSLSVGISVGAVALELTTRTTGGEITLRVVLAGVPHRRRDHASAR